MTTVDPAKLLGYGAVGLGFLLAFLSYLLLSGEQKRAEPRQSIIRAIYSFMFFSFVLTLLGFCGEIIKNNKPEASASLKSNFSQIKPILRSPANRSEHNYYPRVLELVWENVAGAGSYRVESEIQVGVMGENRDNWEPLNPQQASANHSQITFSGANWGRWRVVALSPTGEESQPSDWWLFHFEK